MSWTCSMHINISDVLIIASVIGISHHRPLFLVSVSVISDRCNRYIVISVPIMSFLGLYIIDCFHDIRNY